MSDLTFISSSIILYSLFFAVIGTAIITTELQWQHYYSHNLEGQKIVRKFIHNCFAGLFLASIPLSFMLWKDIGFSGPLVLFLMALAFAACQSVRRRLAKTTS